MFLGYFTEQPLSAYPRDEALKLRENDHPARSAGETNLLFSNRFFDPEIASTLYSGRLNEYQLVEEVGFDGIMTNEHHAGPFCMNARCNITSAVLAGITQRVKIVQLGNPLPLWDNPVQLAEEIAMLDLYTGGRIVSGIIRGGGTEQLANNINPVFNRARFAEAHDLIVKTWTEPGPFSWDGENYQLRVVNPWVLPLQKPHPRIWVPGVRSKETIRFAAEHGYPYICLGTSVTETQQIWAYYDQVAEESGYKAGPEHHGYLMRCHVADTAERAERNAREFGWMRGEFTGIGNPVWGSPTGYSDWESRRARPRSQSTGFFQPNLFEKSVAENTLHFGTPKMVLDTILPFLEAARPGILLMWPNEGAVSHDDSRRCIELLGQEVLPELRTAGQELGLADPFALESPVSRLHGLQLAGASGSLY